MTKKEMLFILNRLPHDDDKIVFEADDIGEVPIISACIVTEGALSKLILMEDFEEFERSVLGNDDEEDEGPAELETGDDIYAFLNAPLPDPAPPRVPEPLVKQRQMEIPALAAPSTF